MRRRGVLRALASLPVAAAVPAAEGRDYRSPGEVLGAIEPLARAVEARLEAIVRRVPRAAPFAASAKADLERHRRERGALKVAGPGAARGAGRVEEAASLPRLRETLVELTHAHAEGLPALGDNTSVRLLAAHMVDLARLVAVVDLWIDAEEIE